jgi:hypothetical protein
MQVGAAWTYDFSYFTITPHDTFKLWEKKQLKLIFLFTKKWNCLCFQIYKNNCETVPVLLGILLELFPVLRDIGPL